LPRLLYLSARFRAVDLPPPIVGHAIPTQGVVAADFDETSAKGFYIQAENCDTDPATSDGFMLTWGNASM
jgi:predicted extracellular nuclease